MKRLINNKVLKYVSLSLIATILIRAVNLISVPVFSRILTTEEYGQADIFMTYVNVFMIILGLDVQGAVGKARLDYKEKADEYISSTLIITSAVAIGITLIINFIFPIVQPLFGLERWSVNFMLIYSYAMFLMSYRSADYNFHYEYKKNIQMSVLVAVFNLFLSVLLIETAFSRSHLLGRILGATIPTVVCGAFIFISYMKKGKWNIKKTYVDYALKFGIPLIPHNLSHLILSNADRLMINYFISASASGIYSLAYTLGLMLQVVSEGFNQVFGPWLFRKLDEGKENIITQVQRLYILVYCMIVICVMALAPEVLKIIAAKEFWEGTSMIIWVVYAVFVNFTYTLYVNIEFFYKKTALISSGTIIAAVSNVVLNALFLKRFGYQFGAVSTVISYIVLLIFHMMIVNCIMKKKIVDNRFIICLTLGMLLACYFMNIFLNCIIVRLLGAVIFDIAIGAVVFYIFKNNCNLQKEFFIGKKT